MKIRFILKFFLKTNYNSFRFSFIIPFIGIFFGSYIIFMTYSIMNSMEKEIEHKINSFNYKYVINDSDLTKDNKNIHDLYLDTLSLSHNSGFKKIVFLEKFNSKTFVELIAYEDIEAYFDKIDPYIKYNHLEFKRFLTISKSKADVRSFLKEG